MSVQLQAGKEIKEVTPSDIFDKALPIVFEKVADVAKIKTTYLISVFGDGGGSWYLDPSNRSVKHANGSKADCVLEMGIEEFRRMTKGTLDAAEAFKTGAMRMRGEPQDLVTLGALLGG